MYRGNQNRNQSRNQQNVIEVKSPYNFVPAPSEDEVFKPEWANQVSHDIPFSDGESGTIKFTITSHTPIFIRNGHSKKDKEEKNDKYLSFSHRLKADGSKEYFIPATSIKGMVRNVLEIMSFSRLKTENDIFPFRDMTHHTYKSEVAQNSQIKTGWLQKEGDKWAIYNCQSEKIERYLIEKKLDIRGLTNIAAPEKYTLLEKPHCKYHFVFDKEIIKYFNGREVSLGNLYKFNDKGNFIGSLVFAGHINNKHREWIFGIGDKNNAYTVTDNLIKKFEEIDNKLGEKTLWQYFKKNKWSAIPVFFCADKNNNISHFGLSRLYKMTNTKYLNELEPLKSYYERTKPYQMDLAETMFGTVADTDNKKGEYRNKFTLKGRVFFGHAKIEKMGEGSIREKIVVLSSPKASYFPFYLQKKQTYLNDATLSGFKKYPIHAYTKPSLLNDENDDIESIIKPLPCQTEFSCKVSFHNLKKVEIGGLLSAITLHGNNNSFFHSIGSGKPLGYGKIRINRIKIQYLNHSENDYLIAFENIMNSEGIKKLRFLKHSGNDFEKFVNSEQSDYLNSDAIKELFAMSKSPSKQVEEKLKYPELELKYVDKKDANEFVNYKKDNLALPKYSEINGVPKIKSIAKKKELNEKIAQDGYPFETKNLTELKKQLKKDFSNNIPKELYLSLMDAITTIFKGHKDSRNKIKQKDFKGYEWKDTGTFPKWLGEEKAGQLKTELKAWFENNK